MKIGELARKKGLAVSTIRFYEEFGLLPPAARGPNGYRQYSGDALERLDRVRAGQRLGLSLETMRGLFSYSGECSRQKTLIEFDARLREVEALLASLLAQRDELRRLRTQLATGSQGCRPPTCMPADAHRQEEPGAACAT